MSRSHAHHDRPSSPLSLATIALLADPKAVSLFEAAWQRLQDRHGRDRLVFPREVVWLNGAPGAGKGTHTSYVLQIRGLSRAVVMSDLLDGSDQLKAIKDSGGLVRGGDDGGTEEGWRVEGGDERKGGSGGGGDVWWWFRVACAEGGCPGVRVRTGVCCTSKHDDLEHR